LRQRRVCHLDPCSKHFQGRMPYGLAVSDVKTS
jgi:hypothetical protein